MSSAALLGAYSTTIHLARCALERGHRVRFLEPADLQVDGRITGRCSVFDAPLPAEEIITSLRMRRAPRRTEDLASLDLLMLRLTRVDAKVSAFARLASVMGVRVVNDPQGALIVGHKAWLAAQKGVVTPETLVTHSRGAAHLFFDRCATAVVVKPGLGFGGRGVSKVEDEDREALDAAFDAARRMGDGSVVVQPYVRGGRRGEKRLVWLDGEVIGGYLRMRGPGEFRHNLKRGGVAQPTTVEECDRMLVTPLSPCLLVAGIRLAGLDVIGGHLIEVNALNPGGAFHTDRLHGTRLADVILSQLAGNVDLCEDTTWAHPVP